MRLKSLALLKKTLKKLNKRNKAKDREVKLKLEEEKRRWKATVSRFDVIFQDKNYNAENNDISLMPGFHFWTSLINRRNIKFDNLKMNIPDMLIVDERVTLIQTGNQGEISIINDPKPSDFLDQVEDKYPHNIHTSFYRPATVYKKPTDHV